MVKKCAKKALFGSILAQKTLKIIKKASKKRQKTPIFNAKNKEAVLL